jgi:hypothetical protein
MKNKSLCTFLTLLAVLFSFDSHSYEIISEKLTVSSGCEGGVVHGEIESWFLPPTSEFTPESTTIPSDFETEIDLKDKVEIPKRSISVKGCGSSASAKAYSVEGKRNNNIMLNSDHTFYICNDTDKVRQFKVYTKISSHDNHISDYEQVFNLTPKECMSSSKYLYLNKLYSKPGSYRYYASTNISISRSSSANDIGTVMVR